MRILFALAGLHRVDRGAEVAFTSVASELAALGEDVTLIGTGPQRVGAPYRFIRTGAIGRERFERFPKLPMLRGDTAWEEASFIPGLLSQYRPDDYDVTLTCSYPFTNWALRRPRIIGRRPPHVFVTQNGNWPILSNDAEYRFFGCEGLICTNPDYFAASSSLSRVELIGNGVDLNRFFPGAPERERFNINASGPVVLMVSALITSKHVEEGVEAVSRIPEAVLVVAGDGPLRDEVQHIANAKLRGRYRQIQVPPADMPALYRSADVFLHLSRAESFGNVYVEAMASGVPTVAIDNARTRWIAGDDAFLVAPGQPAAVAEQIKAALLASTELKARVARRALQFGWTNIARRYREFLLKVIADTRAASGADHR